MEVLVDLEEDAESFLLVETHAASVLMISSVLVDKALSLEINDGANEKLELLPPEAVDDSIGAGREKTIRFNGAEEGFGMMGALASGGFSAGSRSRPKRMS